MVGSAYVAHFWYASKILLKKCIKVPIKAGMKRTLHTPCPWHNNDSKKNSLREFIIMWETAFAFKSKLLLASLLEELSVEWKLFGDKMSDWESIKLIQLRLIIL